MTSCLTPPAGRLGVRYGLVDRPGGRRRHRGDIPRTGGLALWAAFTITIGLTLILPSVLPPAAAAWFPQRDDPNEPAAAMGFARRLALLRGHGLRRRSL